MSDAERAFWVTGPGEGQIRPLELPEPLNGEVCIETLFTGVSRGTEALVFSGKVPPTEYERMRAPFQEGEFPAPVKYGYSNVGRVRQGPDGLTGRTVFCLFPHQTRFNVPADAVTIVPDDVPAGRAVLAANLETAVNGIWDAAPRVGDRVGIVGAGTVGCLAAWLAVRQRSTAVELIDIDPARADVAAELGVPFRMPDEASRDADIVVEASGTPDGLKLALDLAAFEARIVVLSWFGAGTVGLPLGGSFHSRRLVLVSSQVAHIAAAQRPRWDHARRRSLVMRLLSNPELDALITAESPFEQLPDVMRRLAERGASGLCHRIAYR